MLLITTGLLLASFERLQRVDPGFEAQGAFIAQIALPPRHPRAKLIEFYEQFYQRLATLPGASSAALSDRVPMTGNQGPTVVAVGGRPIRRSANAPTRTGISSRHITSARFGFRCVRAVTSMSATTRADRRSSSSTKRSRGALPGEDPVGHTPVTGMAQQQAQVVGVVADIRSESLNTPPEPGYYLPAFQRPETLTNVLVRSNLTPAAVAPLVREALRTIDPDLPLLQPEALTARIGQTVANRKLGLVLLGGFAVLALVLASLGVYSVMAHVVASAPARSAFAWHWAHHRER